MAMRKESGSASAGGSKQKQKQQQQQQQHVRKWNPLFLGFLALAVAACLLSVIAGTMIVPETHATHNMHHDERHPSFDAPVLLRKHNHQHMAQFQKAYHVPVPNDNDGVKNNNNNDRVVGVAKWEQPSKEAPSKEAPIKQKSQNNIINNNNKIEDQKYHMVFSTSCSPFQNWQALASFYFARKVRQPGTVTRLVSGCSEQQAEALRKVHQERVIPLQIPGLQTFEIHFSPDFDTSNGGDQKYFNKPNGLLHWMEESLGFQNKEDNDHPQDDSIVIIVDPDMMLLRPITRDVSERNYVGTWTANQADGTDYKGGIVGHGRPHAQSYGYGAAWITALKGRMEEVVGPGSPALSVTDDDGRMNYPAGPPYIATAKDMYQIAVHWVKFLPKYHEIFDGMMCEMHAYSLAAAHLKLPHKLADGFMVSDYESANGEDFSFIEDKMTLETVCLKPPDLREAEGTVWNPADSSTMTDPAYEQDLQIKTRELPFVLHYCQRYALGRYFFSKYKLPETIFDTCDSPLMIEPPTNVAVVYDWNIFPNGQDLHDFRLNPDADQGKWYEQHKFSFRLRNGWLLCAAVYGVNQAIEHYKKASCGTNPLYFEKTYHFHDPTNFTNSLEDPSNPFWKDSSDSIHKDNPNQETTDDDNEENKIEVKISENEEPRKLFEKKEEENKIEVKKIEAKISETILKISETPKPKKSHKPVKNTSKVNYMVRGQVSFSKSVASADEGTSTPKPTEGSSDVEASNDNASDDEA